MNLLRKIIPQRIINIYHLGQAILANFWYGFPARKSFAHSVAGGPAKKLKVIGVTGTNGKTTTCQMIAKILEEAGFKTAMISTINFKLGEKEWVNKTKYTTLSSFFIQKFAWNAAVSRCKYLILEISSHALDQNRVWGINFDTAVITNVTREHLDYHKTMEEYREAKLRIFEKARVAIINLDMDKPEEFVRADNEIIYGYSKKFPNKSQFLKSKFQKIIAENIKLGINYSSYKLNAVSYKLNLPGLFNIENALAATCVGMAYNIDLETISKALEKIKGIPGRMEYVPNNKGINIIVDFALTPDALDRLYSLIQRINSNRKKIFAVFGSCGRRDKGKRPLMGEVVSKYADYVIVTNEDPYDEDPMQIINEISGGIKNKKEGEFFWRILDRREAIKKALVLAGPEDFVVITGKGHEETMSVGNKRIPWNDKKVILELLRELE
jgi:UDP-N-acetylmuramoyl-L-alanyl-D-glutamate--2,6-diaminopimelate ligase